MDVSTILLPIYAHREETRSEEKAVTFDKQTAGHVAAVACANGERGIPANVAHLTDFSSDICCITLDDA